MIETHYYDLKYSEIYENIFVYHALLPDHDMLHDILIQSDKIFDGNGIFSQWGDWYTIGKICSINKADRFFAVEVCKDLYKKCTNKSNLLQEFYLFSRLNQATGLAISNYLDINNISIPDNSFVTAANPAKYNENFHNNKQGYSMNFHTDYQIGEWWWPGEKFLLTCTTYVNDNYDGGEIEFIINKDHIKYKPKAGDIMVFPSGNPLYPGNIPYYHGVRVIKSGIKFLIRNYLKYYTDQNLDLWTEKEIEYGKDEWYNMAAQEAKHTTSLLYENIFNEDGTIKDEIDYSLLAKKIYNL